MATTGSPGASNSGNFGLGKLLVAAVCALVLICGGVAAGVVIGRNSSNVRSDPDQPRLILRDGSQGEPLVAGDVRPSVTNGGLYRTAYYQIAAPFTSNLADSQSIVQASLAVSTLYDDKVIDNVKDNEAGIRMAIVEDLAAEDEAGLQSIAGRVALQNRLRDVINQALIRKTGYGGIDNVYLTDFITQ